MGSSRNEKRESFEDTVDDHAGALSIPASLASLSPDELARVGRKATLKIDFLVMPALIVMYILNYLDRQNIAAAKLAAITTDLKLSAVQYQSCISLLFVGYVRRAVFCCAWIVSSPTRY
jgi:hypothetical protein